MACSVNTKRTAMFIDETGNGEKLQRIPFMSGSFNEAWLQELLAEHPTLIPSGEFGVEYSPMVCIGREVPVGQGDTQGYIDNLYISPSGVVTIVETKLFRNQESRRTVVAQIIDYAKELQKWDCEKLNEVASDYFYKTEGQAARIIDVMARKGHLTLSDEARLNDSINENLSRASFLLLIVGDGIRSGVQQLADFLNENTSMRFNLGLVEIEVYQYNGGVVVIPNILTKASIVERNIGIASFSAKEPISPIQRPVPTVQEFVRAFAENGGYNEDEITEFILDMQEIHGLSLKTTPTELTIRFSPADSYSYALFTFGISQGSADFWVMPGRIQWALKRHGIFPFEADGFLDFYKQYINTNRCKTPPYENIDGFYYADIDTALNHSKQFITAAEQFVSAITK